MIWSSAVSKITVSALRRTGNVRQTTIETSKQESVSNLEQIISKQEVEESTLTSRRIARITILFRLDTGKLRIRVVREESTCRGRSILVLLTEISSKSHC